MVSLSKSEQKQLVHLLNKLEPGFFPSEIFYALARLIVTATYLVVPLYFDKELEELYVHLIQKEDDDPHWSGLLHIPGKIILPTDKSIDDVYSRLYQEEVKGLDILNGPIFCGYVFDKIPRGKEVSIINYVMLKSKPNFGELHKTSDLPKNIVSTEIKRVVMATEKYLETNKN